MRRPLAVLLAVVVAGVLAPVAGAGTVQPPYARFSLHYTAHDPGSRTGIRYLAQQRTPPAGETAPPVRRLTVRLARGTRFDTSAIRRCRATDAEITTKGVAACPRASRLGAGTADVDLGGAPLHTAATVFNAAAGPVFVLVNDAGTVIRTLRGRAHRNVLRLRLPRIHVGTGDAALIRFHLRLRAAGTRRHPFLRTPSTCRTGLWRVAYIPRFDAPLGRVRNTDTTRCRRGR